MEKALFICKSELNEESINDAVRKIGSKRTIILIILGIIFLALSVYMFLYGDVIGGVVWLIVALLYIIVGLQLYKRLALPTLSKLDIMYHTTSIEITYSFYKDKIDIIYPEKKGEFEVFYSQCKKFFETKNNYIILLGSDKLKRAHMFLTLSKNGFSVGEVRDFPSFIKSKIAESKK